MAASFIDNSIAQTFLLRTGNRTRCRNLVVHPDGALYGGARGTGCVRWREAGGRLYFLDFSGRVRYIFVPVGDGRWVYKAPAREYSPQKWIQRNALALENLGVVTLATPRVDYELVAEVLPSKERFAIVVAKYRENIAWSDVVAPVATIYSKDAADMGRFPVLPNRGYECGTYLHHIVLHYDDLAERTLFLQGDPFPHPLIGFSEYAGDTAPMTTARCEESHIQNAIPWSAPQQRIDQASMAAFLELTECSPIVDRFCWVQGAQFALSREQIRKRPRSYYQRLFELTQQDWVTLAGRRFDNRHMAFIFELFWRYIFQAA